MSAASEPTTSEQKDNGEVPPSPPSDATLYPHLQILQQLQSRARQSLSPPVTEAQTPKDGDAKPQTPPSPQHPPWDLSSDALLATFLHEFSSHILRRTQHVSATIRNLQCSVNDAGVDVGLVQREWMRKSGVIFMEQVVGEEVDEEEEEESSEDEDEDEEEDSSEDGEEDDEDESEEEAEEHEDGDKPKTKDEKMKKDQSKKETKLKKGDETKDEKEVEDDNSEADIARLEAEERSAIENGMKALSLFYDPKRASASAAGGDAGGVEAGSGPPKDLMGNDGDEDVIGDNCYYYPSAEADGFNQRPLPFIVGSREFMESSCAGLGGGVIEEEVVDGSAGEGAEK